MEKKIPVKNYVKYSIIVIISIAVVLYLNSWYKAYKQEQLNNSYISQHINEINYDEFKSYSIENPNLIVYIGTTNCEQCIKVEKDLYKILNENGLKEDTVFLNITSHNLKDLEKDFNTTDIKLNYNIPSIAVLKDSKFTDIVNSDDNGSIKRDLIVQLLEEYEYIK